MKRGFRKTDQVAEHWIAPGDYESRGARVVVGGVSFTVVSSHAIGMELLLFYPGEAEPYAIIPYPDNYRIGDVYSMVVFDLNIGKFEYAYRVIEKDENGNIVKSPYLLDIYAKAVAGHREWGERIDSHKGFVYKARVVQESFDWGDFKQPEIPFEDLVIYELHVRGFTKHESSGVKYPGTFAGIKEKIPYLKDLGINAVELMPIFEFDELESERYKDGNQLVNYWGYNTVSFFAPNTAYASGMEHNHEGYELKDLIKTLNENGIEVILDVVFNHTAEGDEHGPTFSFKGFDKDIYYMFTPDGYYFNFSGCGNTMNCNHPVVRNMIIECLKHWVLEYRVDGFRFDLASILGRDENGAPMAAPPLLEALAFDPVLSKTKLIAEAWDAGGLYQVGSFPSWKRWAEWNGRYRDDMRRFLKSDGGMAETAVRRITGSHDIYDPSTRGMSASVNFITCHDGFTLHDLYAYNYKHNEANGWDNTDGGNDNNSWNCGIEGDTNDPEIKALRDRMRKNALITLIMSRGIPMFLAGDEFGNTQFGNNNAYCQDNEIAWLDWNRLKTNKELHDYVKKVIAFRKKHPVIRLIQNPAECGFPDISIHVEYPWNSNLDSEARTFGIMYAGRAKKGNPKQDDIVFFAMNMHWEHKRQVLPELPDGLKWKLELATTPKDNFYEDSRTMLMIGRSVAVFVAVKA